MSEALGIDVGGTKVALGRVRDGAGVVARRVIPTRAEEGAQRVVERIGEAAAELLAGDRLPVGVAMTGAVDAGSGRVTFAPNLGWSDVPLAAMLQAVLPGPVRIENDATLAAWGEYYWSEAPRPDPLVMLTLGTGVGGGIVTGGRPLVGAKGHAAEVGHVIVEPEGRLCGCGRRGCLETLASGTALDRAAQSLLGPGARARELVAAAEAGHVDAREELARAGWALGRVVGDLITILDPARVVLTGGVTPAGEWIMAPLREEAQRRALPVAFVGTVIDWSHFGLDAGLLGAGAWGLVAGDTG